MLSESNGKRSSARPNIKYPKVGCSRIHMRQYLFKILSHDESRYCAVIPVHKRVSLFLEQEPHISQRSSF